MAVTNSSGWMLGELGFQGDWFKVKGIFQVWKLNEVLFLDPKYLLALMKETPPTPWYKFKLMILDLSARLSVVQSSLISPSTTLPLAHSDPYTRLSCHSSNRTSSYPKTFPLILPSTWSNLPPDISVAPTHLCHKSLLRGTYWVPEYPV